MYFFKTPPILKFIYPRAVWNGSRQEKVLYLTFDDGPVPGATDRVLDILMDYQVKATFFCVGDNITKFPELFKRIIREGHGIGNHTMNHINAWAHPADDYIDNITRCEKEMRKYKPELFPFLFRPPYGKITPAIGRQVTRKGQLIMWDVLSYDFSDRLSPGKCLEGTIRNTRNGSVVLFHDSEKTRKKINFLISQYISYFAQRNYQFSTINELILNNYQ